MFTSRPIWNIIMRVPLQLILEGVISRSLVSCISLYIRCLCVLQLYDKEYLKRSSLKKIVVLLLLLFSKENWKKS